MHLLYHKNSNLAILVNILILSKYKKICRIMSRIPENCPKTSTELQIRLIQFIKDEDYDEKGEPCSNEEFAKRVGVSNNVISKITNYGIIPTVKSLIKIANYLNISLEYLIGRTNNTNFVKSENPTAFHNRVIELKEENKFTFADITNKCTFSRNSIHVWIKRNNLPSLDFAIELASVFNVSIDYLLGRTDYRD